MIRYDSTSHRGGSEIRSHLYICGANANPTRVTCATNLSHCVTLQNPAISRCLVRWAVDHRSENFSCTNQQVSGIGSVIHHVAVSTRTPQVQQVYGERLFVPSNKPVPTNGSGPRNMQIRSRVPLGGDARVDCFIVAIKGAIRADNRKSLPASGGTDRW